jgi:hypothetical protein
MTAQAQTKKETLMTTARKPRGRPFQPGNPGRPVGSKNRTTQLLERLAEGDAEQIMQKLLAKAKAGEDAALRMVVDRLWPPRRGQPVKLDIPPLKTSADVLSAIRSLWSAIGEGHFTPDEASALSLVAERSMQVITQQEILKRIEALEKDREIRNAANFETT